MFGQFHQLTQRWDINCRLRFFLDYLLKRRAQKFLNRPLNLESNEKDFISRNYLDCPLSKGNQAPHPKIWKTKWKNLRIQNYFDLGQELVRPAHLKAQWSDFFEDLTGIKTNQNNWKWTTFFYCFAPKAYSAAMLSKILVFINSKYPNSWLENITF